MGSIAALGAVRSISIAVRQPFGCNSTEHGLTMSYAKHFGLLDVQDIPHHRDTLANRRGHGLLAQDVVAQGGKISHGLSVQLVHDRDHDTVGHIAVLFAVDNNILPLGELHRLGDAVLAGHGRPAVLARLGDGHDLGQVRVVEGISGVGLCP